MTNFRHRGLHFLLLATGVKAAADPTSINSASNAVSPYIGIVFLVLTSLIIFVAIFYYYLKERCLIRRRQLLLLRLSAASTSRVRQGQFGGGLDHAVVKAFPELTYSEAKAKFVSAGPDCAVCLSAFEDHETLRLLPKCGHVFHPDCVGMWLADHTTCPCCRADLLLKELHSNDVVVDVGTQRD
ncbi:hypothetical protein V2J09_001067 [Rumex salicifolius]